MKVFKILNDNKEYLIEEETYIKATDLKEPYCISIENEDRHFAICPECENPIIICNLLKNNAKKQVHGRHYPFTVDNLAKIDLNAMKACKYYTGNVKNPKKRISKGSLSNKLYLEMRDNFPYIILYLENLTGLHISKNFAEELLSEWISHKKWEYAMCNLDTLAVSLIFARSPQNIMKRCVNKNSHFEKELRKYYKNFIVFEKSKNPNLIHLVCDMNNYSNLNILVYRQTKHTKCALYTLRYWLERDKIEHSFNFRVTHKDRINFYGQKINNKRFLELKDVADNLFNVK